MTAINRVAISRSRIQAGVRGTTQSGLGMPATSIVLADRGLELLGHAKGEYRAQPI